MLYRMSAARAAFRAASSSNASAAVRSAVPRSVFRAQLTSAARQRLTSTPNLALAVRKPVTTALVRYASTATDKATGSSAAGLPEEEPDMLAGVKNDAKVIKDTFTLKEVPKEALYFGLAGVIPYLATSLNTCYLAWEINNNVVNGSGFLLSGETASFLLHLTEPIQIGYGAVILSFLGAIHWGLEWAGYGGTHGFRRYATGVIAPAVAWPTLLLPVEHALITQFLAFTFLYYNDARAAGRGLAPHWYGMYRFVLTFVVGASIVATLIGREHISQHDTEEHTLKEKIQALLFLRKKEIEEAKKRAQEEKEAFEE
ncbi:conserved hypothetical protein [Talaromyces stipitatus ATCC 10500]|uniref:Mitochondrial inner membrane protein 1 n=1 Tax=Talaromyces stipitatus (strain ATCC 10500 / CBS 375.48 / QM 6759 / NRRL 1006) TaxID=441959 RepID=B8LVX7_TALSN|nr:uncharacterized protein TSTA_077100 [Talaromyces stipitatus ATCC 10500]EED24343.1 conserved hypothetical protein [Talaromyces stipitatus ATCC 10500]